MAAASLRLVLSVAEVKVSTLAATTPVLLAGGSTSASKTYPLLAYAIWRMADG
ncbi:MAG: hypothetical protein ACE5I2_14900 [Anaerolineae bacterium]